MAKKSDPSTGFTDTKRVKELISLMADNGLTEIELVEDKSRIVLRRGTSSAAHPVAAPVHYAAPAPTQAPAAPAAPSTPAKPAEDDKLIPIKSPMVGTFYAASSPDAPAFVSVGSVVDAKSTVCIIEAMKVFNPIESGVSGTIVKILVNNGQVVEYNQPLFMVKP